MKHARADVDADAVGDLMDDIQEEMATADEGSRRRSVRRRRFVGR